MFSPKVFNVKVLTPSGGTQQSPSTKKNSLPHDGMYTEFTYSSYYSIVTTCLHKK